MFVLFDLILSFILLCFEQNTTTSKVKPETSATHDPLSSYKGNVGIKFYLKRSYNFKISKISSHVATWLISMCLGVLCHGENDVCGVTPSLYSTSDKLKNMPDHGGNRTYDL